MTPEDEKELTEHLDEIAKILYRQVQPEQLKTLGEIEAKVREQTLQYITPQLGFFSLNILPEQKRGELGN